MKRGEIFQTVRVNKVNRTAFNLSHSRKVTFEMCKLIPVLCKEVLPGDIFKVHEENMIRLAPMLAPIMHEINVTTHFFFVPNRLLWDEWEDFITGGPDGTLSPAFPVVTNLSDHPTKLGSLANHLGLPDMTNWEESNMQVSHLPFRAYNLIWNEFYRDQNLSAPLDIHTELSGSVSDQYPNAFYELKNRCWEKDYFTSALPFAQRGPEVSLSLTPTSVPVEVTPGTTSASLRSGDGEQALYLQADGGLQGILGRDSYGDFVVGDTSDNVVGIGNIGEVSNLSVNLANVSAVTINDLRRLTKLQEFLEKNARGGGRYTEQILSHFGIIAPDMRLQRPEYLGGGKTPLAIETVKQMAPAEVDGEQTSVGDLYGNGLSVGSFKGFTREFKEHGFIIAICSVMPRTGYMQGVDKMWKRFDKLDYAFPEFGHIGEQEVKNYEIYGDHTNPNGTFGYQSRYAEYKYYPDTIAGDFAGNMKFWNLARKFDNPPVLNEEFVTAHADNSIFAVQGIDVDHLWCWFDFKITAIRPLPKFGTPILS